MFAISLPGQVTKATNFSITASEGFVSTSEDFRPAPDTVAYNDANAEAADLYELDPNLIRAIFAPNPSSTRSRRRARVRRD